MNCPDRPDTTIAVNWEVKNQTKTKMLIINPIDLNYIESQIENIVSHLNHVPV